MIETFLLCTVYFAAGTTHTFNVPSAESIRHWEHMIQFETVDGDIYGYPLADRFRYRCTKHEETDPRVRLERDIMRGW